VGVDPGVIGTCIRLQRTRSVISWERKHHKTKRRVGGRGIAQQEHDPGERPTYVMLKSAQSALAHTLYKMKVRRARLLGLTMGI
jgi:hypothetical protein